MHNKQPDYFDETSKVVSTAMKQCQAAENNEVHQILAHMCVPGSCASACPRRDAFMRHMLDNLRRHLLVVLRESKLPIPVQQEFLRRAKVHVDAMRFDNDNDTEATRAYIQHICMDPNTSTLFGALGAHTGVYPIPGRPNVEWTVFRDPRAWAIGHRNLYFIDTKGQRNNIFLVAPDELYAQVLFAQLFRAYGNTEGLGEGESVITAITLLRPLPDIDDVISGDPEAEVRFPGFDRDKVFQQPGCMISNSGLHSLGINCVQRRGNQTQDIFEILGKQYQTTMPGVGKLMAMIEQDEKIITTHLYVDHLVEAKPRPGRPGPGTLFHRNRGN